MNFEKIINSLNTSQTHIFTNSIPYVKSLSLNIKIHSNCQLKNKELTPKKEKKRTLIRI